MRLDATRFGAGLATLVVGVALSGVAGAGDLDDADLAALSLDQLMGITVTSASKKAERADEVAAAIFVLTSEDIRRSGATSIPEVLRLVPGLSVASTNANSWAITSRGFNGRFASKLLVLIDGRSVYTPLFSGVWWDVQDTMLEDIERIEVIRGPGATVWGANAVNGVINIITKSSAETQGVLSHAGTGSEERAFGGLRYGGELGDDLTYRAYAKFFDRDEAQTSRGTPADDDWWVARTGFRMDWNATDRDRVTFQGDFYEGQAGMQFTGLTGFSPVTTRFVEDQQIQGLNVIGRWSHAFSESQDASVQLYYDRTDRATPLIDEVRDTFDMEFQHRFALPFGQEVIWGGGYRYTMDDTDGTFSVAMIPDERHDDTFSFFVQDEIRLLEDKVRLTLGTKVENNDYTGWEYQPSVRMAVMPHEDHTFWGAVSRAVRAPSRADDGGVLNMMVIPGTPAGCPALGGPCPTTLVQAQGTGTRNSQSERLYAFEAGWRARLFDRLTLDVAGFYNDYDQLQNFQVGTFQLTSLAPLEGIQPVFIANPNATETWGVELDLRADLTDWWRVIVGYTYFDRDNPLDVSHQGLLRSQMDLPFDLELDATLYVVGNRFQHTDAANFEIATAGPIPSYERLDLRLGWRPNERIELSLVGQNLLERRHPEFPSELGIATSEIQRSVYGKVTYRY